MNRQAVISLASPLAGRLVKLAPEIAGNAPVKLPAVRLVSADPLSAGNVAGNLASAIVPVKLLAGNAPLKFVADNVFEVALNVRFALVPAAVIVPEVRLVTTSL